MTVGAEAFLARGRTDVFIGVFGVFHHGVETARCPVWFSTLSLCSVSRIMVRRERFIIYWMKRKKVVRVSMHSTGPLPLVETAFLGDSEVFRLSRYIHKII
jgi:hypothetical protein